MTLPPLCFIHKLVCSGSRADPFFLHTVAIPSLYRGSFQFISSSLYFIVNSRLTFRLFTANLWFASVSPYRVPVISCSWFLSVYLFHLRLLEDQWFILLFMTWWLYCDALCLCNAWWICLTFLQSVLLFLDDSLSFLTTITGHTWATKNISHTIQYLWSHVTSKIKQNMPCSKM